MELRNKQRIFLSVFFFISGFAFSTWASRIPTIKTFYGFNDVQMGSVLLAMPVSSLIGLPISGWLISRFDSRIPLAVAFGINSVALACIGLASTPLLLIITISVFAFTMRIFSIAVNTQTITLQKYHQKKIIGSFHGLWSSGGIAGVGFSTLMVAYAVSIEAHLAIVAALCLAVTLFSFPYLLKNDRTSQGNKLILGKPDPYILYLGVLVFFAAVCEGGMFDWSGIFFREVLHVEIFTYGYLIFMVFMALSRFLSDRIIEKIGIPTTYVLSSLMIVAGIGLSVIFPAVWTVLIGFSLTGFGTASVVPMTYALAGASKKYSPGLAISIVATYATVGMLVGPPLIGYLSHAFGLRMAFVAFAVSGLLFIPVSRLFFLHQKAQASDQPQPVS
ncbi:MFS transporter [Persicitalea jodogahamensis]|uniref:MFS transporter n=1 Tax=Persicitalea jodogahamensis TaxID=402147 RepID=A0A8J3D8V8_9BACT|nr:MFS transporter [Persicitalea jodogahamensis]GHB69910.1 MFS transporter [Persicitalea jodogahamensis]